MNSSCISTDNASLMNFMFIKWDEGFSYKKNCSLSQSYIFTFEFSGYANSTIKGMVMSNVGIKTSLDQVWLWSYELTCLHA